MRIQVSYFLCPSPPFRFPSLFASSPFHLAPEGTAQGPMGQEVTDHLLIPLSFKQIWAGAGVGLLIAFAIGAAFIAVVSSSLPLLPWDPRWPFSLAKPFSSNQSPHVFSSVFHYVVRYLGQIRGDLGRNLLPHRLVSFDRLVTYEEKFSLTKISSSVQHHHLRYGFDDASN